MTRTLLALAALILFIALPVVLVVALARGTTEPAAHVQTVDTAAEKHWPRFVTTGPPASVRPPAVPATHQRNPERTTAPPERVSRPAAVVPDATWDLIAACESGQRWDDRRGGYEGGLHFSPWTWRRATSLLRAAGSKTVYAAHAYLASRRQQIDVANDWLRRTSWAQWPVCSRKAGLR